METMETTRWGDVSFKVQPDGARRVHLLLDGVEYTMEVSLDAAVAYRLGRGLIECAEDAGLGDGFVRD